MKASIFIFIADILLTLNQGIYENFEINMDRSKILQHFLYRGECLLDIIPTITLIC